MKEMYFSKDTIDAEARGFLEAVEHLRKKREMRLQVNRSALLVLDMQRYFLEEESHAFVPSAGAIKANIKLLQDNCLNRGIPVFHTRHINTPGNAGQMKQWWRNLISRDNPFSEIVPDIADERANCLEKSQYDAFLFTALEQQLLSAGVRQLVITGVMTHLCCESTARSAFARGFEVFFTVDATATYNRQFHRASLLNLSHGFAVPVLTGEILSALNNG